MNASGRKESKGNQVKEQNRVSRHFCFYFVSHNLYISKLKIRDYQLLIKFLVRLAKFDYRR